MQNLSKLRPVILAVVLASTITTSVEACFTSSVAGGAFFSGCKPATGGSYQDVYKYNNSQTCATCLVCPNTKCTPGTVTQIEAQTFYSQLSCKGAATGPPVVLPSTIAYSTDSSCFGG